MKSKYPPEVQTFIAEQNKGRHAQELADLVNATFGTSYTADQIKGYRARRHLNSGLTGRFEQGHTPYNKVKKGRSLPGMEATQFKKGHRPHNAVPVGTEGVNTDGYRVRKIAEPNVWRPIHILNWEAVHGPVPAGHCLVFKDGDRMNCNLSNLLCVTRGELAVMNKRGLHSSDPQCTEVGLTIARLVKATHKRKKERKRKCSKLRP